MNMPTWDSTFDTLDDAIVIPRLSLGKGQARRLRLLVPIAKSPAALYHEFRRESDTPGGTGWYTTALCLNNQNGPHGCPLCKSNRRVGVRVFLIFWAYQGEPEPRVEVWERSRGFVKKSLQPKENLGYDLLQQDLAIQKLGEGIATTYSIDVVPAHERFILPAASVIEEQINAIDWDGLLNRFLDEETLLSLVAREQGEGMGRGGTTPPSSPPPVTSAPPMGAAPFTSAPPPPTPPPAPPSSIPPGGFAIQTE